MSEERGKRSWFKDKLKTIFRVKEKFASPRDTDHDYHKLYGIKKGTEQVVDDHYYQQLLGIKRMPQAGTLNNIQAREWYLYYEAKIPEIIDKTASLAEQARQAYQLRSWCRIKSRQLMVERELALQLAQAEPNLTLEQVRQNQIEKGLAYDDLTWEGVIRSSTRSRASVNGELGIDPHKNELEINPLWRSYVQTPRSRDEAFESSLLDKKAIGETSLSHYEKKVGEEREKCNGVPKKVSFREQKKRKVGELEI